MPMMNRRSEYKRLSRELIRSVFSFLGVGVALYGAKVIRSDGINIRTSTTTPGLMLKWGIVDITSSNHHNRIIVDELVLRRLGGGSSGRIRELAWAHQSWFSDASDPIHHSTVEVGRLRRHDPVSKRLMHRS